MGLEVRKRLSREDIDIKAEEVLLHFDPLAFSKHICPLYELVNGFKNTYGVPFHFEQDLGYSRPNRKILGRFDFAPRQISIDKFLPHDSPRFRWTLAHEIGHLVLHRNLNPELITKTENQFVDTREQLHFMRTALKSELEWVEWQANQFASSLLLPRPIVYTALVFVQTSSISRAQVPFIWMNSDRI